MNEEIVKDIVMRILSSPELQSLLVTHSTVEKNKPSCLIVVNNQASGCQLSAIKDRFSKAYSLTVCAVDGADMDAEEFSRISYEQVLQGGQWERVYIPSCSGDQLAQIALGLCNDQTSKVVAKALVAGIAVEIGQVDLGFTAQTPEKYRQMFENYRQQALSFGIVIADAIVPQSAIALNLLTMPQSETRSCKQEINDEMRYDKRLLSDKEALNFPGNGVVQIAKSTVLTPTAIDILKKKKVEVYREGVRCF